MQQFSLCIFAAVLSLLALLIVPRETWPTTVIRQSLTSLVQEADIITVGTVSTLTSEWDTERNLPFIYMTLTDLDVMKGKANQSVTLRMLGGTDPEDGARLHIAGVPTFTLGERVLLFITGNRHYAVPFVGLWQGVYRVVFDATRDMDTIHDHVGQPVTERPLRSGDLLHDSSPHRSALLHTGEALPLDTFLNWIEQEVDNE